MKLWVCSSAHDVFSFLLGRSSVSSAWSFTKKSVHLRYGSVIKQVPSTYGVNKFKKEIYYEGRGLYSDWYGIMFKCAIDNNEQILRLLLRHGADVNAQDTEQWTPLHAAACCAHIDIVRLLIDKSVVEDTRAEFYYRYVRGNIRSIIV